MITSAQTFANTAATNGYSKLSSLGVKEGQLGAAQAATAADAESLSVTASLNNDPKLSQREVLNCLVAAVQ